MAEETKKEMRDEEERTAHPTATTGVDNPLYKFTELVFPSHLYTTCWNLILSSCCYHLLSPHSSELAALQSAESAAQQAYAAYRSARDSGASKDEIDKLEEISREKEETLKGLQDFCD